MMSNAPIGLFDSGIGGLTVVQEVFRQLPQEEILYFGDTLRCPYGDRDKNEIIRFSTEIGDFLVNRGVKLLIIACNTATATSLSILQQRYDIPVIGVISPGSRAAISMSKTMRVGVIGTRVTVASDAYAKEIHRLNPKLYVVSQACPEFVPIVENDRIETEASKRIVARDLASISTENIDTLILGCTHYPLLKHVIQDVMGSRVQLINSAEETAREASTILSIKNLLNERRSEKRHKFFVSANVDTFRMIGERWLGRKLDVELVDLFNSNQPRTFRVI
ncbi:glutamate racemase [Fodinisporobacter ferrooxydans]|uniref:Glutamate racemase n=1 Tax=Fodinisporobacter ferrooxydans TaxID=2901836 RepID=A0ABY4CID2_9BACL|nr:glutamate racemase [Alicyclobacillaceae bacterium MYW30-H2]